MELLDIQVLIDNYHRLLAATSLRFKRYLYQEINWNVSLLGIKGARGVGKTTLLLQHIKETFTHPDHALYVSLDNFWFATHKLEDLVAYCYSHGIRNLYLDEVHRYPNWSKLIKNFADSYPQLKIVYTGSALLAIDHSVADLSRRQTMYTLKGLSFREFLQYEGVGTFSPLSLEALPECHVPYALQVAGEFPVLKYFDAYLEHGYYPYYKDAGEDYPARLAEVTRLVLESDAPSLEPISASTITKMKQLLMIIAGSVPMEINISKLVNNLETTRDQCLKMLYLLDRAGLLHLLTATPKSYKHLCSPKKMYLDNTNLMHALHPNKDIGTWRETFFANQVGAVASLTHPLCGDFLVEGQYLFEVGGANKTFHQIAHTPHSYLAIDSIETGSGARIPLWLFGMLY